MQIELRAHTDCIGDNAYNQFLSLRRAQSVKQYLVAQGIAPERLVATGIGEREPVNHCTDGTPCSPTELQANRRTEFILMGDADPRMVQAPR